MRLAVTPTAGLGTGAPLRRGISRGLRCLIGFILLGVSILHGVVVKLLLGVPAPGPAARGTQALARRQLHVDCGRSPVVVANVIVDRVSLVEEGALALLVVAEVELVDEDVVTTRLRARKPETLLAVKPLDNGRVLRCVVFRLCTGRGGISVGGSASACGG